MKNKQSYLTKGSFALLLFVILGYIVKFYPEQLVGFDSPIQTWLRGDLPAFLTTFFKLVTSLIDPLGIIIWVSALSLFFLYKKWKLEAALLAGNLILHGILIKLIKLVYQRSRPSLSHLVEEGGYSFPSGHSMATAIVVGSLIIIVQQRMQNQHIKRLVQGLLLLFILTIMASRVYLGVHYPTDVIGGVLMGFAILNIEFPFYDKLRFQWRFKGKQK
ncbi:phosphatase PAP2 family protein [Streptococcus sinensis]|uniref:Membrane-associated phospholipid phosphatase n=1 Tax=Streptococcus sinensis TaxID=176090 RepID=A0A0A0DKR4_9STRE|nr:phosphatase PAP2 family protein [Streptococcus sinensis]KGM37562.1 Membrane-associated phospholipid phosphatase [Streptococcus sinensis]